MYGCQKNDENEKTNSATTYAFTDNTGNDGFFSEYSILLCEYDNAGSKVHTEKLDNPVKGQRYAFTANNHAEKLKVKIQAKYGTTSFIKWIQQVFYLEIGGNVDVTLEGSTIVGSNEP